MDIILLIILVSLFSFFDLDRMFRYKIANVANRIKTKVIKKIVSMIRKLYYKGFLWNYILF